MAEIKNKGIVTVVDEFLTTRDCDPNAPLFKRIKFIWLIVLIPILLTALLLLLTGIGAIFALPMLAMVSIIAWKACLTDFNPIVEIRGFFDRCYPLDGTNPEFTFFQKSQGTLNLRRLGGSFKRTDFTIDQKLIGDDTIESTSNALLNITITKDLEGNKLAEPRNVAVGDVILVQLGFINSLSTFSLIRPLYWLYRKYYVVTSVGKVGDGSNGSKWLLTKQQNISNPNQSFIKAFMCNVDWPLRKLGVWNWMLGPSDPRWIEIARFSENIELTEERTSLGEYDIKNDITVEFPSDWTGGDIKITGYADKKGTKLSQLIDEEDIITATVKATKMTIDPESGISTETVVTGKVNPINDKTNKIQQFRKIIKIESCIIGESTTDPEVESESSESSESSGSEPNNVCVGGSETGEVVIKRRQPDGWLFSDKLLGKIFPERGLFNPDKMKSGTPEKKNARAELLRNGIKNSIRIMLIVTAIILIIISGIFTVLMFMRVFMYNKLKSMNLGCDTADTVTTALPILGDIVSSVGTALGWTGAGAAVAALSNVISSVIEGMGMTCDLIKLILQFPGFPVLGEYFGGDRSILSIEYWKIVARVFLSLVGYIPWVGSLVAGPAKLALKAD